MLLVVPLLRIYNHTTEGKNGDFQLHINHQKYITCHGLAVDFFARGLHTCTAVALLPLRQSARHSCRI